jgi:hypothetical protein
MEGGTSRGAPIVITTRIIGDLDSISIITPLHLHHSHHHPHFLTILLYFLDLIVDLHMFPSILMYPIYIHVMMMVFPSMNE